MHQIQTLIDRVRAALADERIEKSKDMEDLARDLQEVTRKINERLRRCGEYLRQGLRAEAIQEAETEPRLLDAVGVVQGLTEDEWKRWQELAQFLELPLSEPPLQDVAQMIDEAYGEQAPLEILLKQHRKLALQRAPLSLRLTHLRQLALNDPNSEIWQTDVRAYEEARLAQIVQIARTGGRGNSIAECRTLLAEVQDAPWTIALPPKLVPTLQAQLRDAGRKDARSRLGPILEKLQAAHAANNFSRAIDPYREWTTYFPLAELSADDPIVRGARDAVGWCEESTAVASDDTAWAAHLGEIERSLARPDTAEESLRRLADQTDSLGRSLPFDLESRLLERIDSFHTRRTNKRLLIAAGTTVAMVAFVVGVTISVERMKAAETRKDVIAEIDRNRELGNFPRAKAVRDFYMKYWSDREDWKAACASIDQAETTLEERVSRIEMLLDEAATVPVEEDLRFDQIVAEANGIADQPPVLPLSKQEILKRTTPLIAERQGRMKARNDGVAVKLAGHAKSLEELKATHDKLSPEDGGIRRSRLRKEVTEATAGLTGLPPEIVSTQSSILAALDELERGLMMARKREQLLVELKAKSRIRATPEGVAEVKAFAGLLRAFASELKTDPLAAGLERSFAEADLWGSLFAVRKFPQNLKSLFPDSVPQIAARRTEVTEFLKAAPRTPLGDGVQKYLAALAVLENRYAPDVGLIAQLSTNVLDAEYMQGLNVVRDLNMKRPYYIVAGDVLAGMEIVNFTRWSVVENAESVKLLRKNLASPKPVAAPQIELSDRMRKELQDLSVENWDRTMSRTAKLIVAEVKVDPILRLTLLRDVCGLAKVGSLSAGTHKPFLDFESRMKGTIDRINLRTDWSDPKSPDVEQRRERCVEYLTGIAETDFDQVWPTSSHVLQDIEGELLTPYSSVGWMTHDDDGEPTLDVTPPAGTGALLVVVPEADATAAGRFETVGRYSDGLVQPLVGGTATYFVPGRLVFARPASSVSASKD